MEHVEKLARALEEQFDGIFEDIAAARNKYNLEAATSFELDQLCEFFSGVDRYGKTDEELRNALRVAIAIEGSLGVIDSLCYIIKLMTDADKVVIHNHAYGVFTVEVENPSGNLDRIKELPAAGCKINWVYEVQPETFRHDEAGVGLDQGEMP